MDDTDPNFYKIRDRRIDFRKLFEDFKTECDEPSSRLSCTICLNAVNLESDRCITTP